MNKIVLPLVSLLLLFGCAKAPEAPVKQYAMKGEVLQLDPSTQVATIKHENIEGFMHAMTMEYGVRDKQDFAKLHKGDKIDATVFVQGDDYWVGHIKQADVKPVQ